MNHYEGLFICAACLNILTDSSNMYLISAVLMLEAAARFIILAVSHATAIKLPEHAWRYFLLQVRHVFMIIYYRVVGNAWTNAMGMVIWRSLADMIWMRWLTNLATGMIVSTDYMKHMANSVQRGFTLSSEGASFSWSLEIVPWMQTVHTSVPRL